MTDDELRRELGRIDPAAGVPVDRAGSPRARDLVEGIMSTSMETGPARADGAADRTRKAQGWRRWQPLAAAAAAVAVLGVGAVVAADRDGADRRTPPAPVRQPTEVQLALPAGDAMASCMMFDVAVLAQMSPALRGQAVSVTDDAVVLDVERWYRGGDADRVRISKPPAESSASLDGVAFEVGQDYLITASGGTVNGCGFSGPATPELEAAFAKAFPS